jgi:broad specificity phosphatase PhoE
VSRTTVHLLRHGEVYNPDRILYGRMPGFRLSDDGLQMAVDAAEALRGRDVTEVVSSPLQRAQETARPIAAVFGLEVTIDDRLIEAANIFEGARALEDGAWKAPENWRYLVNPFQPSWGEPYDELAQRMLAAVEDVRDRVLGHEAVCVSHQLPIVIARRCAEGRRLFHDPRKRQCSLASVTSFTFDDGDIVAISYAEPAASLPPGHGAGA